MSDLLSISTPIDLSRLPAPAIVETLSFEAILAEMVADLRSRGDFDAIVESDPAIKILQVCAYRELIIRQRVNDAARAVMIAYATGADLEQLAAIFGVVRLTGENDDDLRRRVVLAPESYSVAGPIAAYVFHALSAHPDVRDASVASPSPGEVVVTILSRLGNGAAASDILAAVTAVLSADGIRPLTDHVTVQSAAIVSFAIAATVYTYAGPDSSVVLVTGRARLDAYLANALKLGRNITDSGIKAALHVEGVQRVVLPGWSDIVVSSAQAGYCTGIAVTHGGYDN